MALRLLVIGGGISGLSLAYAIKRKHEEIDLTVLESAGRTGGKIWSERADGFLCESGVNGFLDNKPATLELASELSLAPLRSSDAARKRFVYSGGKLKRLPESPGAFLRSSLIGPLGKLRIAFEPFVPRGSKDDESLADFARRRLGRQAYETLIDPMASGIYAGDPEALSLKSCFPRINQLEQTYGSLIKGMFKLMAKKKKSVGAGPGGTLTSFPGGMQVLTDALTKWLGEGTVRTGCKCTSLEKVSAGYAAYLADGSAVEADAVALAVPAHQGAVILKSLAPQVSRSLQDIAYPSLAVVCTGFRREKLKGVDTESFGFLVPAREGRKILGALFDSSIFPGLRSDGEHFLLRSMVGGARASHLADLDDRRLADTVMDEISRITGLRAEPDFVRIYRHEKAIPQYNVGHAEKLRAVDSMVESHRGLYVTGNAFRGIGVNDCIGNSFELAGKISEEVL